MHIYQAQLPHSVALSLGADGLLVAMQMITLQGISVNIKWKVAQFACLPRNGTRIILSININVDNNLNVKQKINTHGNEEHMSCGESSSPGKTAASQKRQSRTFRKKAKIKFCLPNLAKNNTSANSW